MSKSKSKPKTRAAQAKPAKKATKAVPVKSTKPKPPAKPAKSAKPATHAKPVKPAKLVKPVKQAKPITAPKLAKSAQQAKPVTAPKLAKSAQPIKPEAKPRSGKSIMESAQQIWLAGLGAFAKAQGQGGQLFEALLREGSSLEQKTRKLAGGKVGDMRDAVESSVTQVRERTQETWDRLEQVFENRVAQALATLGVPARKELDELAQRVDELNRQVKKFNSGAVKSASSMSHVMSSSMRRARDDLSDLARELEEAQLAAKQPMKRSPDKVKKPTKSAPR